MTRAHEGSRVILGETLIAPDESQKLVQSLALFKGMLSHDAQEGATANDEEEAKEATAAFYRAISFDINTPHDGHPVRIGGIREPP